MRGWFVSTTGPSAEEFWRLVQLADASPRVNEAPGLGMQALWRPTAAVSLLTNNYWGHDTAGNAGRQRFHSDNSIQVRYREDPTARWSRGAVSLTVDAGCESGGGVRCAGGDAATPAQYLPRKNHKLVL